MQNIFMLTPEQTRVIIEALEALAAYKRNAERAEAYALATQFRESLKAGRA